MPQLDFNTFFLSGLGLVWGFLFSFAFIYIYHFSFLINYLKVARSYRYFIISNVFYLLAQRNILK